jgi:hypothetical protein
MAYVTELPATAKRSAVRGERPRADWDEDVFQASDTWLVPREDLAAFLRVAGGTVESIGGVLTRIVPLRFKEFPFAIADKISWQADGWDRTRNDFDIERVSIQYSTPKYGDDFTSVDWSPDVRAVNKPVTSYSGIAPEDAAGLRYNLTMHKLASVPLETWRAASGKINNAAWRGFATGTVKFDGPSGQQRTTLGGETTYQATLVFRVNRLRWDYDFDATGAWVSVGSPPTEDFTAVFGA